MFKNPTKYFFVDTASEHGWFYPLLFLGLVGTPVAYQVPSAERRRSLTRLISWQLFMSVGWWVAGGIWGYQSGDYRSALLMVLLGDLVMRTGISLFAIGGLQRVRPGVAIRTYARARGQILGQAVLTALMSALLLLILGGSDVALMVFGLWFVLNGLIAMGCLIFCRDG